MTSLPGALAALMLLTGADAAPKPKTDAEIAAALPAYLDELARKEEFSGAVLVAHGDKVVWRGAVGLADRAARRPNTPDTKFNLGSINKVFTRHAVEVLAHDGRLALSDTLDRYVPEYTHAKRVTLQQLVDHTAGTGDVFGPRYDAADRARLRTLRDWLPLIEDRPLAFEPGTREEYSNAGYVLLGLVIERVTGRSYDEHVRETIFVPAGMTGTASYAIDEAITERAVGYTRRDGTWTTNATTIPGRGSSAGGGYSTVDDLRRFADALRTGALGPRLRGGLGVTGGAPGINAALEMMPEHTVVVLANQDPPAAIHVARTLRAWIGDDEDDAPQGRRVIRRGPAARPEKTTLPPGGVSVPMTRADHLPAVSVTVNGQGPFLFAIDTGGAGSARVTPQLAEKLGLKQVGEVRAGDPSGRNVQTLPLVRVDAIGVGGARFEGLDAAVRDFSGPGRDPVDGVLGFGLFAETLLTLDFPGKVVRVEKGTLEGDGVIAYEDPRGIPSIRIGVAGRELAADVDVGAGGGFILPEREMASLPLAEPAKVVGRARTISNTFDIKAAPLRGVITVGALTFEDPTVEFQPVMPDANLGARVLGDLVLTFDQVNKRLRLSR